MHILLLQKYIFFLTKLERTYKNLYIISGVKYYMLTKYYNNFQENTPKFFSPILVESPDPTLPSLPNVCIRIHKTQWSNPVPQR